MFKGNHNETDSMNKTKQEKQNKHNERERGQQVKTNKNNMRYENKYIESTCCKIIQSSHTFETLLYLHN